MHLPYRSYKSVIFQLLFLAGNVHSCASGGCKMKTFVLLVVAMLIVGAHAQDGDWRARFNEVYRLNEGEVLKCIAPPFIPEREVYYRTDHRGQYQAIKEPPD